VLVALSPKHPAASSAKRGTTSGETRLIAILDAGRLVKVPTHLAIHACRTQAYYRSVNRSRITVAALALFVVLAAGVVVVMAPDDAPRSRAARAGRVPHWLAYHRQLLAEAAKYERKHPGASCDTDPPHNVYATQLMCMGPDGQEIGLILLVAEQP
jgi:hypothetical protein